jgi:hypothetical protein
MKKEAIVNLAKGGKIVRIKVYLKDVSVRNNHKTTKAFCRIIQNAA